MTGQTNNKIQITSPYHQYQGCRGIIVILLLFMLSIYSNVYRNLIWTAALMSKMSAAYLQSIALYKSAFADIILLQTSLLVVETRLRFQLRNWDSLMSFTRRYSTQAPHYFAYFDTNYCIFSFTYCLFSSRSCRTFLYTNLYVLATNSPQGDKGHLHQARDQIFNNIGSFIGINDSVKECSIYKDTHVVLGIDTLLGHVQDLSFK